MTVFFRWRYEIAANFGDPTDAGSPLHVSMQNGRYIEARSGKAYRLMLCWSAS